MQHNVYIYILLMAVVSFVIRVTPMVLIRKPIRSKFIRSFLHYVPYVTLAVMTFPAIYQVTATPLSGIAALLIAILATWLGQSMLNVALISCITVFLLELVLPVV